MCLAIPARLIEYLDDDRAFGKVELGGVVRRVNTTMLVGDDSTEVGEYVLVHVGFAMAKVSETEAKQNLEILRAMGAVFDDEIKQMDESDAMAVAVEPPRPSQLLEELTEDYRSRAATGETAGAAAGRGGDAS